MEETAKETMIKKIQTLPDDSTVDEILHELLFQKLILEGLEDERGGKMISHEEVGKLIKSCIPASR